MPWSHATAIFRVSIDGFTAWRKYMEILLCWRTSTLFIAFRKKRLNNIWHQTLSRIIYISILCKWQSNLGRRSTSSNSVLEVLQKSWWKRLRNFSGNHEKLETLAKMRYAGKDNWWHSFCKEKGGAYRNRKKKVHIPKFSAGNSHYGEDGRMEQRVLKEHVANWARVPHKDQKNYVLKVPRNSKKKLGNLIEERKDYRKEKK